MNPFPTRSRDEWEIKRQISYRAVAAWPQPEGTQLKSRFLDRKFNLEKFERKATYLVHEGRTGERSGWKDLVQTPFIELPACPEGTRHLMHEFIIRSQPQIAGHIIPQSAEIVFAYCWCTSNPHIAWAAHSIPDLYCLGALCGELFFVIPVLSLALGEEIKLTWFIYESFVIRMIEGHSFFCPGTGPCMWSTGDLEPMEFLLGTQMRTGDK